ncbi:hypothetical protein I302_102137 [Kwoniella bestiolae CBS 10118]|uniref:Uncharacterized protein n=1 Tax=Kwoniella bestiolae CBS 10118 TaxID=1296100 RepID=A0A1B9GE77_9TREE|nr:hypothetical protein I302_00826 [Kwoniella bestiolae CBS 10118]OCF29324.1 hypothetical protein I302_00826 [Kwoniella bestiolae CBS 10118]
MVELSPRNIIAGLSGYAVPPLLPIPVLRLIPMISSTVSLQWAIDEYQFLSSWLPPTDPQKANDLLPQWFRSWGPKSTMVLFTSFPFSAGAGFTNLYNLRNTPWTLDGAKTFYALGTALAFGHMVFGPKALGLLKKIRNGEPDGRPTESLGVWLKMHVFRTVVTDLPAVVCFLVAAVKAGQGEY